MTEPAQPDSDGRVRASTASTWAPFIIFAGVAIAVISVVGTIAAYIDLSDTGFDELEASAATKWLSVLAGMTAIGVGIVTITLGVILQQLDARSN